MSALNAIAPDPIPASWHVTIILVTYNSRSILHQSLPPLASLPHLVVVDNNSADDTTAVIRSLAPNARLLQTGANIGFGRANNLALERVETPYALLLNPDCVLGTGTIEALVKAAHRYPDAAILAPKHYVAADRLGLCYRPRFWQTQPIEQLDPDGDLCSEFLTGAAMLLVMKKMRTVGFFDPWFFLYFEDDDLCLRARAAGHSLVLVDSARVDHHVKSSSAPSRLLDWRRTYCMTLSKFYALRKHRGALYCAGTVVRVGIGALLALPLHALRGDVTRLLRQAARLVAALTAPARLQATHCIGDID